MTFLFLESISGTIKLQVFSCITPGIEKSVRYREISAHCYDITKQFLITTSDKRRNSPAVDINFPLLGPLSFQKVSFVSFLDF